MAAAALLLALASAEGGVVAREAILHRDCWLDLDTGLVANLESFAGARGDLRFAAAASRLEWASGATRAAAIPADARIEEIREVSAEGDSDPSPIPLEIGAVVPIRTSEGHAAKLRILRVDAAPAPPAWDAPPPRTEILAVRVEWFVSATGVFPPGPPRTRTRIRPEGVEVDWDGEASCRIERVDEDGSERVVLADDARPPFLDASAADGGFYRYEVARRLGEEGLSDRSRAYAVRADRALRGEIEVTASSSRLDLARGVADGPRHDLSIVSAAAGGVHFAPAPRGALRVIGRGEEAFAPGAWLDAGSVFVATGGSVLVRTPDGRRARVRVDQVQPDSAKSFRARVAAEFLADPASSFVESPGGVSVAFRSGKAEVRWTHPDGEGAVYRVERERGGSWEPAGEVRALAFEDPAGERLHLAYRVVRVDDRGDESLPSAPASSPACSPEEIGRFAERLTGELGAADFARREEAARALRSVGADALPALRRGRESSDPEIAERSEAILETMGEAIGAAGSAEAEAAAAHLVERFGAPAVERLGLRDAGRRLVFLLSPAATPEDRAHLAARDADPLVREVAASRRFALDPPWSVPGGAGTRIEPYAFDRIEVARLFDGSRSGAEIAEDLAPLVPARPTRDAWLLRTVVEALRDPALPEEKRERSEVALRALHRRPPGDASALAAAEGILGDAFAPERARALRAIARARREEPPREAGRREVGDLAALSIALADAPPGTAIVLRPGDYAGDGETIRVDRAVTLAAAAPGVRLGVPLRIDGASDVRLEGLEVAPATAIALQASRAAFVAERCVFGPSPIPAQLDSCEAAFFDCRFEGPTGRAGGGAAIHAQRGRMLIVDGGLLRGSGWGIQVSGPALVERTLFDGAEIGQAALHQNGDAFVVVLRCAFRRWQTGLSNLSAGLGAALAFDGVVQPSRGLAGSFAICQEDATSTIAIGSGRLAAPQTFSECEAGLRPR